MRSAAIGQRIVEAGAVQTCAHHLNGLRWAACQKIKERAMRLEGRSVMPAPQEIPAWDLKPK